MPAIDVTRLKTYPLASRRSKVAGQAFAKVCRKGGTFREFFDSLPDILVAGDLRKIVSAILTAHRKRKPVLFMMGSHVLKVGLNPLIIELLKRGVVTAIALNGSGIIHDFEIAYQGQTSEDVAEALADGSFGMAEETHRYVNGAIVAGAKKKIGLGRAVGQMILQKKLKYRQWSLLATCAERDLPATVHVAIGTDIIHQQATADGAAIGQTSLADFRTLAGVVAELGEGGVACNLGSSVILPEVFLKAVSVARNLGHSVKNLTTCDFDMIRHYRPRENVLVRPTLLGGQRFGVTGHHEIMIPLLVRAILEQL
ncbi:MAG: hypothetical protein HY597_04650 [Candidatus Omnitrophica bacterium]|nr:hypothetical protein [Candidatus Omnitrophota bacterium]